MDAQKPKIPTLKDAKSTKPDFKIKGLSALSFMERLKQFKKKDLAFIMAGLGVLFMAPLVEHFMMAPESGDPSAFKEGFGSRGDNGGIGRGGSPYEGGYNGLAPGGLLGSGSDVITPLNVRDPSALVMGPSSSAPTPVSAPKPSEPATAAKSDWKDALANAGSRASKEVVKNASLPVPKIPLQGGLRGLGVLGGGGGGGSYSLPAISASNVPNSAAGSNSLRSVSAPGYKGLASRGPNVGGSGGMEGLKKGAGSAGDAFNRGGAASGLENAAATSMGSGADGSGGAGAGGASAGEKGSSQNSSQGGKNQGESLEFLMRKQRMEKELEMYYKKLEKKDWELFGYDLGHKLIENIATKLVEGFMKKHCLDGSSDCDDTATYSCIAKDGKTGYPPVVSPKSCTGTTKKDAATGGLCISTSCDGLASPCIRNLNLGGAIEAYGCKKGVTGKGPEETPPGNTRTVPPGDVPRDDSTKPTPPSLSPEQIKAMGDMCSALSSMKDKGVYIASKPQDGKANIPDKDIQGVKTLAGGYLAALGNSVSAAEAMTINGSRGTCGQAGNPGNLTPNQPENIGDRLNKSDLDLKGKAPNSGGLVILKADAVSKAMKLVENGAGSVLSKFLAAKEQIDSYFKTMSQEYAHMLEAEKEMGQAVSAYDAAKAARVAKNETVESQAEKDAKQKWVDAYKKWEGSLKAWNDAKDKPGDAKAQAAAGGAAKEAKDLAEFAGSPAVENALAAADKDKESSKNKFGASKFAIGEDGQEKKGIGGYVAANPNPNTTLMDVGLVVDPKSNLGLVKASMDKSAVADGPAGTAKLTEKTYERGVLEEAEVQLSELNKKNKDTYSAQELRYKSQAGALTNAYGTTDAKSEGKGTHVDKTTEFVQEVRNAARGAKDAEQPASVTISDKDVQVKPASDNTDAASVRYFGTSLNKILTDQTLAVSALGESELGAVQYNPDGVKDKVEKGNAAAKKSEAIDAWYKKESGTTGAALTAAQNNGTNLSNDIEKTNNGIKSQ